MKCFPIIGNGKTFCIWLYINHLRSTAYVIQGSTPPGDSVRMDPFHGSTCSLRPSQQRALTLPSAGPSHYTCAWVHKPPEVCSLAYTNNIHGGGGSEPPAEDFEQCMPAYPSQGGLCQLSPKRPWHASGVRHGLEPPQAQRQCHKEYSNDYSIFRCRYLLSCDGLAVVREERYLNNSSFL